MGETTGEYLLALVQGDVLLGELLVQGVDLQLEGVVLDFETFGFLALALTGVVCSGAVALDTFDAALFLLVGSLCPLPRWEVGLGFRECLAP